MQRDCEKYIQALEDIANRMHDGADGRIARLIAIDALGQEVSENLQHEIEDVKRA